MIVSDVDCYLRLNKLTILSSPSLINSANDIKSDDSSFCVRCVVTCNLPCYCLRWLDRCVIITSPRQWLVRTPPRTTDELCQQKPPAFRALRVILGPPGGRESFLATLFLGAAPTSSLLYYRRLLCESGELKAFLVTLSVTLLVSGVHRQRAANLYCFYCTCCWDVFVLARDA